MARCLYLPVLQAAMDLASQLEHAVQRLGKIASPPRYHKCTLGTDLRQNTKRSYHRRWLAHDNHAGGEETRHWAHCWRWTR